MKFHFRYVANRIISDPSAGAGYLQAVNESEAELSPA